MPKPIERMSEDDEEKCINMVFESVPLYKLCKHVGMTIQSFQRYCVRFPDFNDKIQEAMIMNCAVLEDELLSLCDSYNWKEAEIRGKHIVQVLKYRNRARYGDKQELQIHQTIDISTALNEAMSRVIDVTPKNVVPLIRPTSGTNNN